MTAEEFRAARRKPGLSQGELAQVFGMGENGDRAVRQWESGERAPNPIACTVLGWLLNGFDPRDY